MEKAVEIYNNSKHSSTGFSPKDIFFSKDKNLFKKIKENILLSQKYKKNKYNPIIENEYGLLCENFKLEYKTFYFWEKKKV